MSILVPLLQQRGIDPSVLAMMNNGGFGGQGQWFIWILFLLIFSGWGGNGFGGFGGNGTGFLANQMNNDAGRDLLLQAIQGNGSAISQLASVLNSDVNAISAAVNSVQSAVQSVSSQVGMSGLQTVNAIQQGNSQIASQLAQCCCENRLLTTQQGYESRIATIEQTNQLGSQADRNTRAITDAIAAQTTQMTKEFCEVRERELQDKIDLLTASNTAMRNQIDNANQTAQIQSYISSVVTPIQSEVAAIKAAQPATVTVQYPQLTAIPNYALYGGYGYNSGIYGNGYWS